ncbi:MAG: hypothetical protein Kow00121_49680 [Elainellaceae cyanobacterium]
MAMNKLAQFLQEDNGNFSSTRLAFLAWVFGTLIIWCNGSFQEGKMQEIPQSIQVLIGIFMTGKVTQKFREEQPMPGSSQTESLIVSPSRIPESSQDPGVIELHR